MSYSQNDSPLKIQVQEGGQRLDRYLAEQILDFSRSHWTKACTEEKVLVNGQCSKPSKILQTGDQVVIHLIKRDPQTLPEAEDIPLTILYEDEGILIVDKPRGMVVHPAPGHSKGTLVNALLAHCQSDFSLVGDEDRPGIVHRIDKDTSGLLLVAKTEKLHRLFSDLIHDHLVKRDYCALCWGHFPGKGGTISAPIGRDPQDRKKMAVVPTGREAVTHFQVVDTFPQASELKVSLETGRTHQIRVHLASLHHPVVGDPVYGGRRAKPPVIEGQALHAWRLRFTDPRTGQPQTFESSLPQDYLDCRKWLQSNQATGMI